MTVKDRGLCLTCNHDESCTIRRNLERPVVCCEEFDGYAAPPTRTASAARLANTQVKLQAEDDGSSRSKGLCSNCDNRKTCTLPQPEGGVWHCEEYQ